MSKTVLWMQHAPIPRRHNEIVGSGIDRELDDAGVECAENLAESLSEIIGGCALNETVSRIRTSPLRRALATAGIVSCELKVKHEVDENLSAQHFGALEGYTIEEANDDPELTHFLYGNNFEQEIPFIRAPGGGESIMDVFDRMRASRTDLLHQSSEGAVLAITHGSVLNTLLGSRMRMEPARWDDLNKRYQKHLIVDRAERPLELIPIKEQ